MKAALRAAAVLLVVIGTTIAAGPPPGDAGTPGRRVLLDAHNCYPYQGRWADRLDRALATGLPVAIEQDLLWRPATATGPGRSIVSHGGPFTGEEPGLREYFFERVRPLVTRALASGDRTDWPLIVLNLDFKTNEPEHHQAIWNVLGEYDAWLTTATRTATPDRAEPLDVRPILVLTGSDDRQQAAFHDTVPIGGRLRVFGAIALDATRWARETGRAETTREELASAFWQALPGLALPRATNYRRWWNNAWSAVEHGGQRRAGEWTQDDEQRLRTLVSRAHEAGLWVRYYTLNGYPVADEAAMGVSSPDYNFGTLDRARERWGAAIAAGVDFVATDQYEAFAVELAASKRSR